MLGERVASEDQGPRPFTAGLAVVCRSEDAVSTLGAVILNLKPYKHFAKQKPANGWRMTLKCFLFLSAEGGASCLHATSAAGVSSNLRSRIHRTKPEWFLVEFWLFLGH